MNPACSCRRQRGASLFALLFWAIAISFIGLIVLRVFPTVNEYITMKHAIERIMQSAPGTPDQIRTAFEREKAIEYSISTLSGKDLDITTNNDKTTVSFAYDKEIELFDPVYLLIKYQGSVTK
jgi:hypothetical protein